MELIYLYIHDDGKNLKDCEFNFSPEFRVSYDRDKHFISMVKNNNYIPNFWSANMSCITAIIGKNGVGKSNLIDCIINTLCGQMGNMIIWKHRGVLYRNKSQHTIDTNIEIRELDFWGGPLNNSVRSNENITDSSVIYFSPNIDRAITEKSILFKFKDISSANILRTKKQFRNTEQNNRFFPDIDFIQIIDTFRLMIFFKYYGSKFLPKDIRLPEYLDVTIRSYDINNSNHPTFIQLKESVDNTFEGQLKSILINQIFSNNDIPENWNNKTSFEEVLKWSLSNSDERPNIYDELIELYNKNCIICDLQKQKAFTKWDSLRFSINRSALSIRVITALFNYYFNQEPSYASFTTLDLYTNMAYNGMSIKWDGLSSGELAFYTLIARINSELTQHSGEIHVQGKVETFIDKNTKDYKAFILVLDEPELSFHPEWQQKFLSLLIDALEQLYPTFKFQIVLASHSPILVSDFPKDNIIFLDKNPDGTCKVVDSISRENTFGANIHTLYRNSFFIDGLPIGEFAKKKINKLFNELENEETIRPSILKEIQMIGEPIIRDQLMKLYKRREGLPEDVNRRITELEQEISILKGRLDDKN